MLACSRVHRALDNWHFVTMMVKSDSGKNHQWRLNLGRNFGKQQDTCIILKVSLQVISQKGKHMVEKLDTFCMRKGITNRRNVDFVHPQICVCVGGERGSSTHKIQERGVKCNRQF